MILRAKNSRKATHNPQQNEYSYTSGLKIWHENLYEKNLNNCNKIV
jgi:hypothetical protein